MLFSEFVKCKLILLLVRSFSVPAHLVFHIRNALALNCFCNDNSWLTLYGFSLFKSFLNLVEAVTANLYNLKAKELDEAKRDAKKAKRYNTAMMIITIISMLVAVAAWLLPNILGGAS